jgi:hypothetical protein
VQYSGLKSVRVHRKKPEVTGSFCFPEKCRFDTVVDFVKGTQQLSLRSALKFI